MSIFKFTIYDFHEYHELFMNEDEYSLVFKPDVKVWCKFKFAIDFKDVHIIAFREFKLFNSQEENVAIDCTKVFLSDGSVVYAVWQFDTFEKNLNEFKEELKKATD